VSDGLPGSKRALAGSRGSAATRKYPRTHERSDRGRVLRRSRTGGGSVMAGAERYDRGKLRLESFDPGRQLNRWEQFGPLGDNGQRALRRAFGFS
jgi:hypothetical protein